MLAKSCGICFEINFRVPLSKTSNALGEFDLPDSFPEIDGETGKFQNETSHQVFLAVLERMGMPFSETRVQDSWEKI